MKVEKCAGVSVCVCASIRISGLCRLRKGSVTVISRVVLAAGAKVQRNRSRTARHTSISPSGEKKKKKLKQSAMTCRAFFSFFLSEVQKFHSSPDTAVVSLPLQSPTRAECKIWRRDMKEADSLIAHEWFGNKNYFPSQSAEHRGDADLNASRQMGEE